MGTKLIIGKETYDLPRGAVTPNIGDVLRIVLRGQQKEKLYTVHLVEHEYNFNGTQLPKTEVTLKVITTKKG